MHDLSDRLIIRGGYGLGKSLSLIGQHSQGAELVEGFSMEAPQERLTIKQVMGWLDVLRY